MNNIPLWKNYLDWKIQLQTELLYISWNKSKQMLLQHKIIMKCRSIMWEDNTEIPSCHYWRMYELFKWEWVLYVWLRKPPVLALLRKHGKSVKQIDYYTDSWHNTHNVDKSTECLTARSSDKKIMSNIMHVFFQSCIYWFWRNFE